MLKRFFWLALGVAAGLAVWLWLRQREEGHPVTAPQFAPPRPFDRPALSSPSPAPAPEAAPTAEAVDSTPDDETDAPASPLAAEQPLVELEAPEGDIAAAETTGAAENGHAKNQGEPDRLGEVIGYCVRCKTKRPIGDPHEETTESGRRAARGTCPVCGANMFTFLKDEPDSA